MIELPGDSEDYHLITKGIELSQHTPGLTCEIGLRRGGGTKAIIDALAIYSHLKTHIAIDPYGNIEYEHKEGEIVRLDYTNQMKYDCLKNLYAYAQQKFIDFQFFNLEDTEFFKRYADGVPTYNHVKTLQDKYSFVFLDGPHAEQPLIEEIGFFIHRIDKGACVCFDDITGYYNHDKIEQHVFELGFELIQKTHRKALYQYKG